MISPAGIRVIDVLYRVSTRAQEAEGESLYNQRREIEEKWAAPAGIVVRKRIEVAESGKSALRLSGRGFEFDRRAQYAELIVEYQTMAPDARPDAVLIDWVDRWSRNAMEYMAIVSSFRGLGIRMIAIGDGLDLTDCRNDLVTNIRAAVAQEQLRITKEKVSEARRSRRERGKWQGGSCPDGYRTHNRDCPGLKTIVNETPDGKKHELKIRVCDCPKTVLQRDPAREPTITFLWSLLQNSPLSWAGMAAVMNDHAFVRPNGKPWGWHDLYRCGENPHYAGILTFDRYVRDKHDGAIKKRRALLEQQLVPDTDSILDPYLSVETFWEVYKRRFNTQTRYQPRAKRGNVSELLGILFCPSCERLMSSYYGQSPKRSGHGNPRRSPIKYYVYMRCSRAQGPHRVCANRQSVRVDGLSAKLIAVLAKVVMMTDHDILAALKLQRSMSSIRALESERKTHLRAIEDAPGDLQSLIKQVTKAVITQDEFEVAVFRQREEKATAQRRLREIESELTRQHARPDFSRARETVQWLSDHWTQLTVAERAEAIRKLVDKVSYMPNGTVHPEKIRIVAFGQAFVKLPTYEKSASTPRRALK